MLLNMCTKELCDIANGNVNWRRLYENGIDMPNEAKSKSDIWTSNNILSSFLSKKHENANFKWYMYLYFIVAVFIIVKKTNSFNIYSWMIGERSYGIYTEWNASHLLKGIKYHFLWQYKCSPRWLCKATKNRKWKAIAIWLLSHVEYKYPSTQTKNHNKK